MTFDDLQLLQVQILLEFRKISYIREPTKAKLMKIDLLLAMEL